jgi:large subunit ribosomal protein L25
MIREVQVDPLTGRMIHADLLRISMEKTIEVKVPIHLSGTPLGVKNQGGILDFVLREIEVSCLPGDIPDGIDADVSGLELGTAIKVSDLKIPAKVKVLTDAGKPVATVVAPAAEKAAEAATVEAAAEAAPAEPEVIKKGKAESAEGATEGSEAGKTAGAKGAAAKGAEKPGAGKPEKGAPKEKGGGKEKGGR